MELILSFLFGTVIGSFLNVVILRLPEEESLDGRSGCPSCGHSLSPWDLVPILSFVFLRGRCRYCKHPISRRYPLIETITGLLFLAAWVYIHPGNLISALEIIKFWLVISVLIAVFVIDLEHFLILDKIIFPASASILLLNFLSDIFSHNQILSFHSNTTSGLMAALALTLPFYLIWYFSKGLWLGFGDVKLVIFLGLSLGFPEVLAGFMVAVLSGGLVATILLSTASKTMKSKVPFGTFLSFGALVALFYGRWLVDWYLGLIGI